MSRLRTAVLPLALLAAALAGPTACWGVPAVERRTVRSWLTCSDCTEGEFAAVVAMGPKATRYLRAAIADGPSLADDSILRLQATEGVVRARRYRADRSIPTVVGSQDSSATVEGQLVEFRFGYRLRAVEALHAIDAPRDSAEVKRLCENPPSELLNRPDLRALLKPYGPCP